MSKQKFKNLQDPALWEGGVISPKLYFEYRLNPLIEWNELSATRNRWTYKTLKFIQLFLAALVPVLVGFIGDNTVLKYFGSTNQQQVFVAVLGFILTFITSLFSIFQFKDNWIDRAKAAEDMRRETMEYLSRTAAYYQQPDGEAFNQLVQRVEGIISGEYKQWIQSMENNGDRLISTAATISYTKPDGTTSSVRATSSEQPTSLVSGVTSSNGVATENSSSESPAAKSETTTSST